MYRNTVLSHPKHKWEQRFLDGPLDFGFDSSFISMLGIQDPPYVFFEDDVLLATTGLFLHVTLDFAKLNGFIIRRRLPKRNSNLGGGDVLLRHGTFQNPTKPCRGRHVPKTLSSLRSCTIFFCFHSHSSATRCCQDLFTHSSQDPR